MAVADHHKPTGCAAPHGAAIAEIPDASLYDTVFLLLDEPNEVESESDEHARAGAAEPLAAHACVAASVGKDVERMRAAEVIARLAFVREDSARQEQRVKSEQDSEVDGTEANAERAEQALAEWLMSDEKRCVRISELVPKKIRLPAKVLKAGRKLAPFSRSKAALVEKLLKGFNAISASMYDVEIMVPQGMKNRALIGTRVNGAVLGIGQNIADYVAEYVEPKYRHIPDRKEPCCGEGNGRCEKALHRAGLHAATTINAGALVGTFSTNPAVQGVVGTALPAANIAAGTILMVDGSARVAQSIHNGSAWQDALNSYSAMAAAVGAMITGGTVVVLVGHPVGWAVVGTAMLIADAGLLRSVIKCGGEKDAERSSFACLEDDEVLSIDEMRHDPRTCALFDSAVIVEDAVAELLEKFVVHDEHMITNWELEFLDAEIGDYKTRTKEATTAEDREKIREQIECEITDGLVAAAVLRRIDALKADGSKPAWTELDALVDQYFRSNIKLGVIRDNGVEEALLLRSLMNVYSELNVDHSDLESVLIGELFLRLNELGRRGARVIKRGSHGAPDLTVRELNLLFKEQYIRDKQLLLTKAAVKGEFVTVEDFGKPEDILRRADAVAY